ncbi:response regulator receiver domain-containing protein [Roseimicrobium gellanilyticum]|uniref:Response regulator receiver domain-containing protein n=1 Tax=Roseimicrobium gellanilyticum TaxID=748857 RepID=A0A366HD89_9BACT|nr:response regulator [Roseimicrobium gellanilyticum]RBP40376.1 response regulator receiver domain-containing protein [Roseimicrobium gellanilyticum]
MSAEPPVIAIVDDEPRMRSALCRLLRVRGYAAVPFEDPALFLQTLETRKYGCVVLDLHMPEINGFDVLECVSRQAEMVPVIVITGHDQPGSAERVQRLGALVYLTKPVDEEPLLRAIEAALAPPGQTQDSQASEHPARES